MTILTVTLHPAIDKVLRTSRLVADGICRTKIILVYGGGKGNNAARALVRMGMPVIATGFQGGSNGIQLTEFLQAEGIQTEFIECKAQTRVSTLIQEVETGHTYAIYEPGQIVDHLEINDLLDKYLSLIERASICLLCGTGQSEALANVYSQMIEIGKKYNVRCLLDSSGLALANSIVVRPHLLKVNISELSDYFGRELISRKDQIDAIRKIQATGIEIVALSCGKDGMVATDGKEVWEAKLSVPNVTNVVGCGDSLLAGLARAICGNASLCELVRWGVACGAANTQVNGAGFITMELVNSLIPKVETYQIV